MTYQESIIGATEQAVEGLFRTARAMPADKLEWSPLEQGRTALDLLRECAQAPTWLAGLMETKKFPEMTPEVMEKGAAERASWKTIDECEAACKENSAVLYKAMCDVPEDDLTTIVHLPFGGGMDMPLMAIMTIHHWNTVYHTGQVNYIQTLYGDKEMH